MLYSKSAYLNSNLVCFLMPQMRHHPLLSWAAGPRDGSLIHVPSFPRSLPHLSILSGITFQAVYLHLNLCLWVCLYSFIICMLVCAKLLWRVWLFVSLWTVAWQAPLAIEFSRQEYWSGLSCPPPGDLPDPGIDPTSLTSPALAGGFFATSATWEDTEHNLAICFIIKMDVSFDLTSRNLIYKYTHKWEKLNLRKYWN